jgi:hypothetical protein
VTGILLIGEKYTYEEHSAMMTKARMTVSYHHEGITNPQRIPSLRTMWNLDGLTVNCDHHSWSFTY